MYRSAAAARLFLVRPEKAVFAPSMALTLRAIVAALQCSKTFLMFLSTFADYSLKLAIKPAK
jgi:hypothetical protein